MLLWELSEDQELLDAEAYDEEQCVNYDLAELGHEAGCVKECYKCGGGSHLKNTETVVHNEC